MFEVMVEGQFSAAHQMRGHAGLNGRIHGHNFSVQAVFAGVELNQAGLLMDFSEAKGALAHVIGSLEHESLNDLESFRVMQPSCECLARYIYRGLLAALPGLRDGTPVRLIRVTLHESSTQGVTYTE